MISVKLYLIVVTTLSVVNGKTVDSVSVEHPTTFSSYSQCNKSIKSRKEHFYKDKKNKRKRYSYTYNKISCKSKTIKTFEGLSGLFKLKF